MYSIVVNRSIELLINIFSIYSIMFVQLANVWQCLFHLVDSLWRLPHIPESTINWSNFNQFKILQILPV